MRPTLAVGVMGHHSRYDAYMNLIKETRAESWAQDDGTRGENANGDEVWRRLAKHNTDWCLVVQDDAILVPDFREHVIDALSTVQVPTAVSFYVGTSRPRRRQVIEAITEASKLQRSWLRADELMWGVAVAMPTAQIPGFLEWAERNPYPYDQRIGMWFQRQGLPIYYTFPSLADHSDVPSVVDSLGKRQPRLEPRVAHSFGVPGTWDTPSVLIPRNAAPF